MRANSILINQLGCQSINKQADMYVHRCDFSYSLSLSIASFVMFENLLHASIKPCNLWKSPSWYTLKLMNRFGIFGWLCESIEQKRKKTWRRFIIGMHLIWMTARFSSTAILNRLNSKALNYNTFTHLKLRRFRRCSTWLIQFDRINIEYWSHD